MGLEIPPFKAKILLGSNPPKSRILVGRLAVVQRHFSAPQHHPSKVSVNASVVLTRYLLSCELMGMHLSGSDVAEEIGTFVDFLAKLCWWAVSQNPLSHTSQLRPGKDVAWSDASRPSDTHSNDDRQPTTSELRMQKSVYTLHSAETDDCTHVSVWSAGDRKPYKQCAIACFQADMVYNCIMLNSRKAYQYTYSKEIIGTPRSRAAPWGWSCTSGWVSIIDTNRYANTTHDNKYSNINNHNNHNNHNNNTNIVAIHMCRYGCVVVPVRVVSVSWIVLSGNTMFITSNWSCVSGHRDLCCWQSVA